MDGPLPSGLLQSWTEMLRDSRLDSPFRSLAFAPDERVFRHPKLFPLQRKRELTWMLEKAHAIEPSTVMEIGTDKGGGFYHWVKCLPSVTTAIACEIRGIPYASAFEEMFSSHRGHGGVDFRWLPCSSASPAVMNCLSRLEDEGTLIDVLFIDGDKGTFMDDFKLCRPFLSDRAVVFLHDVQDDGGPRETFKTLSRQYRHEEYVNVHEWHDLEDLGLPPASEYEAWLQHWKGRSCGVGVIHFNRCRLL